MSTTIKSFKDLRVWQISESIWLSVYQVTSTFPKEEVFGLISQMRRAAVSLPSNIAEGFGRRSAREKEQFYRHALGSLFELEAQIGISKKLNYLSSVLEAELISKVEELKAALIKLIKVNGEKIL